MKNTFSDVALRALSLGEPLDICKKDCVASGRLCRLADRSSWPTEPGGRIQLQIVYMLQKCRFLHRMSQNLTKSMSIFAQKNTENNETQKKGQRDEYKENLSTLSGQKTLLGSSIRKQ
uniref:Uncharacterized protein n=1 Tax=Romanomermis culicivorax TaxID=13658 RepID=A0A915ITT5_ROMCU